MEMIDPAVFAKKDTPFVIADHHLVSSNVTETEYTEFSITESVSVGDQRQVTSASKVGVTLTIASPCYVAWVNHFLVDNTPVRFTTTGALPTGVTADQVYYVVEADFDGFKLALKPGGTPIVTSGTQSGTHTAEATIHGVYEPKLESAQASSVTISGTTMNVPAAVTGALAVGMVVAGSGVVSGTRIVAGPEDGGIGTYTVSISQTAGATIFCRAPYSDTDHWLRIGSTNLWRMHDYGVAKQTANQDSIANSYTLNTVVDAIAFFGINAATVRVKVTDNTGSIYDITKTTEAFTDVTGKTERFTDVLFNDLPNSFTGPDIDIDITLTATGETVFCGACVMGRKVFYGDTQKGVKIDFQDYSVKESDDFGNISILERDFSDIVSLLSIIKNSDIWILRAKLASFKAKPVVYIGTSLYSATVVLGFFEDFSIEIPYTDESLISIEVQGVTRND